MVLSFALLLAGIGVTIWGGDLFVDASVWIAKKTGMPRLLIGATIVSFATTLPEFLVSIVAVLEGANGLCIGNAIGSVTSNTALVLALCIVVLPTRIPKLEIREKGLLVILSAVALLIASRSGVLTPLSSIPLFLLAFAFVLLNIASVKCSGSDCPPRFAEKTEGTPIKTALRFVLGAGMIVGGAKLMVDNGVAVAKTLGISESFVAITMIALGTSLPELVTTLSAIRKKEPSIAVGNILGANILDLTLILPVCSVLSKTGLNIEHTHAAFFPFIIHQTLAVDLPVCIAALCIALLPAMKSGQFRRWQGVALLLLYCAYLGYLLLSLR